MAKWTSPLFTDIRGTVAKSQTFSTWKGRQYLRTWVTPANPKTVSQQAQRDLMKQLVKRWQTVIDNDAKKAAWNKEALPFLILGFNVFVKFGSRSAISLPATGTTTSPVTITYTTGFAASKAKVYAYDGTNWSDITPAGGLSDTPNSTFQHTFGAAATYEVFIADADVLVSGDSPPQPYQAITKYSKDTVNGVAKEAKIVIS